MSNARIDSYRGKTRQPLIVLAMHVGRYWAASPRPVTVADLQEQLHCSASTAARYLAAYNAVYSDVAAAQASGALSGAAAAIVAQAPAGSVDQALAAHLRAAAARSDEFDNCDDAGADDAAA